MIPLHCICKKKKQKKKKGAAFSIGAVSCSGVVKSPSYKQQGGIPAAIFNLRGKFSIPKVQDISNKLFERG